MTKTIIGLTEKVTLVKGETRKVLMARVDTGATQSSIDTQLATDLNLGPLVSTKTVKSSHGSSLRVVVRAELVLKGKKIKANFNLADRRHMKYKVLLGINALRKGGVLIDPEQK